MAKEQLGIDEEFKNIELPQQLVKKESIEGTPFEAVELANNEGKMFIALGNHMLTEPQFKTKKEIEAHIKVNMWDLVLKISFIAAKSIKE